MDFEQRKKIANEQWRRSTSFVGWALFAIGAMFELITLTLGVPSVITLVTRGISTSGVVLSESGCGYPNGLGDTCTIHVQYVTQDGRSHIGVIQNSVPLAVGSMVAFVYDPINPEVAGSVGKWFIILHALLQIILPGLFLVPGIFLIKTGKRLPQADASNTPEGGMH